MSSVSNDQGDLADIKSRIRGNTLVLVGLMGAGKTTVGRRLAQALDLPFKDSDAEIEKAAGLTISELFEKYGEAEFREGEKRVMARLMQEPPQVLATGGGAFVNEEIRALIAQDGISIWLSADLDVLAARVSKRNTRPLLKNGKPREILAKLMNERRPAYSQADIHVTSDDRPHSNVVKQIIHAVDKFVQARGGVAHSQKDAEK